MPQTANSEAQDTQEGLNASPFHEVEITLPDQNYNWLGML